MKSNKVKFCTKVEEAQKGDVIKLNGGQVGIKVSDTEVCWKQDGETDGWWLHRAEYQKTMLEDIEARRNDGTLATGARYPK